jgi:dTDP-3-amino-3,4,6-trideoxy-alpha-D-glucose transaminase
VTAVPELAERLQLLRSHGERPRYNHRVVGTTARLDALQAAVLRRKLARLDGWNEQRRAAGLALRTKLTATPQARSDKHTIELTELPFAEADHVYHLFVVRTDARDELREHLAACGVASAIHYPTPIHLTGAYADLGMEPGSLPVSERLAERMCSLPLFPSMTDTEIQQIADAVASFAQAESY